MTARPPSTAAERTPSAAMPRPDGIAAMGLVIALLLLSTVLVAEGLPAQAATVALAIAGGLSLRYPRAGVLAVGALLTVPVLVGPLPIGAGLLASPLAVASTAAHGGRWVAVLGALWHLSAATLAGVRGPEPLAPVVSLLTAWTLLLVTAVLAGERGRALSQRARRERSRRIDDLARQRHAIARELHDTGVRAMTQVVLLAQSAERRRPEDTEEARALRRIAELGRSGVSQMRDLLEELRTAEDEDHRHAPSATDVVPLAGALSALRDRLAAEGFEVHLHPTVPGEGDLDREVEAPPSPHLDRAAAPRDLLMAVLGEAEANLLVHGDRGRPVRITVRDADDTIHLRIVNSVDPRGAGGMQGGSGLLGMSERLVAAGGELRAGEVGGRYVTEVVLPARPPRGSS